MKVLKVVIFAFLIYFIGQGLVVEASTSQSSKVVVHKVDKKQCQKYVNSAYEELYNKKNLEIIKHYGFEGLSQENILDASSDFDKALKNDESCVNAYAGKAEVLRLSNDINNAKTYVRKALSLDPNNIQALFTMASLYLNNLNNKEQALVYYNKLLNIEPQNKNALLYRAKTYIGLNQQKKAIEDINKLLSIDNEYLIAYAFRADCYLSLKEYQKAVNDYSILLKKDKKNVDYLYGRALAYAELNNKSLALADINTTVKLKPENAESYFNRLQIYSKIGASRVLIEKDLKSAEKYIVNNEYELSKLMHAYFANSRYKDVIRLGENVLKNYPNNVLANLYMAYAYNSLSEYNKALEIFNKKLSNCDLLESLYYERGFAKLGVAGSNNTEMIRSAIVDLTKSITLGCNLSSSYLYRGSAYVFLGEYQNALNDFAKFESIVENSCVACVYQKAYANYMLKRYEEALNNYYLLYLKDKSDISAVLNVCSIITKHHETLDVEKLNLGIDYLKETLYDSIKLATVNAKYSVPLNKIENTAFGISQPYKNAIEDKGQNKENEIHSKVLADLYAYSILYSYYSKGVSTDEECFNKMLDKIVKLSLSTQVEYLTYILPQTDNENIKNKIIYILENENYRNRLTPTELKQVNVLLKNSYLQLADKASSITKKIEYIENAVFYGYSKIDAYKTIAYEYYCVNDYFNSSTYLTKALNIKKDAYLYYQRGGVRTKLNDYSGALNDFNMAIKLKPNYAPAYWNRASIYFDRRQYNLACADYKKYLSLTEIDKGGACYNIGVCLYNVRNKKAAYPYFQRAKDYFQQKGDRDSYNDCVRMMNKINGYYY